MQPSDEPTRERFVDPVETGANGTVPEQEFTEGRNPDDDVDDDLADPSFFSEEAQCHELLQRLASQLPALADGSPDARRQLLPARGADRDGAAATVEAFAKVLDRYQECPHLLYPHLEGLIAPLVALLVLYLPPAAEVWDYEQRVAAAEASGEEAAAPSLDCDMFDADAPKTPIHLVCHALYRIVKTAGEKACTSHFPNDVQYYEDVFYALRFWNVTDGRAGSAADALTQWAAVRAREWEVRYCLLLWLCNLVLVPFSLRTIDSTSAPAAGRLTSTDALSDAVLLIAVQLLSDTSKCRDGAALLVARLLTRPDSKQQRDAFFQYATGVVAAAVARHSSETKKKEPTASRAGASAAVMEPHDAAHDDFAKTGPTDFLTVALAAEDAAHPSQRVWRDAHSAFLLPGILTAMSKVLKLGQRQEMLPYAAAVIPSVVELQRCRRHDVLLSKVAVKVVQRLVLVTLRNSSASWKYTRHEVASLAANLGGPLAASPPPAGAGAGAGSADPVADEEEAIIEGDQESLEEGIGLLLETLAHADTIVRWSAAKGVGRVCERLPREMALEVVEAVEQMSFLNAHSDAAWHGGLLALAELCRRSVIDAKGLDAVVPRIAAGLVFDLAKGIYSVGAHVRDAACYACWSIARAYDAADLAPHVQRLSTALVTTALLDREVNVRRAAAAAFQECVGRLGNFPDGIELVTAMDFFSLATRSHAYQHVAVHVAQYSTYRGAMLQELVGTKLLHWDRSVRENAAIALGRIAAVQYREARGSGDAEGEAALHRIHDELQRRVVDANVAARHGAILGLAGLVGEGLSAAFWSEKQREQLANVVVQLDQARLFRARGGEHVRHACCRLLSACAAVHLPLPESLVVTRLSGATVKVRTLGKWQEFLEGTWTNILEWLQLAAAEAFAAVAAVYYTEFHAPFHGKVIQKMLTAVSASATATPLERRGFLAAMGGLPAPLLLASAPGAAPTEGSAEDADQPSVPYFVAVLDALCRAAVPETNSGAADGAAGGAATTDSGDAECRRNAVTAMARVLERVPGDHPQLTPALYARILRDALLAAMCDYTVDARGDVGSFVRIAALNALPSVVRFGLQHHPQLLSADPATAGGADTAAVPGLLAQVMQRALQAAFEKLDRVRRAAGVALVDLLLSPPLSALLRSPPTAADHSTTSKKPGPLDEEHVQEAALLQSLVEDFGRAQLSWEEPRPVMETLAVPLLLRCPSLFAPPVAEGLVISAGDVALHISRPACDALDRALREASDEDAQRLSALLVQVGWAHAHEERVLVPLSRTLDLLLNRGLLCRTAHVAVVGMLRSELRHYATNIMVLLPFVSLLATMCRSNSPEARRGAWALSLTMIASRFPKVRARMATDFCAALAVCATGALAQDTAAPRDTQEQACRTPQGRSASNCAHSGAGADQRVGWEPLSASEAQHCAEAMSHLLQVQWDSPDAATVRAARDELYGKLGLPRPVSASAGGSAAGAPVATRTGGQPKRGEVAGSYAALVQETGY